MKRITLLTNPDKCNLNCPLCFLNQRGFSRCSLGVGEMSFETARAAIEKYVAECDASGKRVLREVIPSTMGEPLLYSHFDELLALCESLELPLNLTTNGTFPGKWGSDAGMAELLRACSDIKVSYLASEQFDGWKANVEKLLDVRQKLMARGAVQGGDAANSMLNARALGIATVSLQVTLHKKNVDKAAELVSWASSVGINRIKWNPVVLLSTASQQLREMYALDDVSLDALRKELCTGALLASNVKHEGSLFFNNTVDYCAVGGKCESCPFADEVWVWPDGHEDHCPNPERRFGGGAAFLAE
jgi:MoaA/NifB/PqqE/SkfB family radical SAM enzyme